MIFPLYRNHGAEKLSGQGNTGLWWNKFFCFYDEYFSQVASEDSKKDWIGEVEGKRGNKQVIERFAQRQFALGAAHNAQQKFFKTEWHLATGLGYSHPVENGFCWHHTLGVPYLPASGIKGLLRAWVEQWEEFADEKSRKKVLLSWFGNEPKEEKHDSLQVGKLIFFDVMPVNQPELSADVMTPHMGKWYAEGQKITSSDGSDRNDASRIPGDWHSPVPVPFLVIKNTSFLFQIAARPKSTFEDGYDLSKAMELLQMAVENLGFGAKTAAGYGRMSEDIEVREVWQKKQEEDIRKQAREQEREAKQQAAAAKIESEETVIMIAEPDVTNRSVMIKTELGEEFECTSVPAYKDSQTSVGRWSSGDEDDRKIEAKVTRENGTIMKVLFVDWY